MSLRTILKGLNKVSLELAPSGKDLFGTVVNTGVNDKTVTVNQNGIRTDCLLLSFFQR